MGAVVGEIYCSIDVSERIGEFKMNSLLPVGESEVTPPWAIDDVRHVCVREDGA